MRRQQKVRNPISNAVLMAAIATHELALDDLGFHQETVQVTPDGAVAIAVRGRVCVHGTFTIIIAALDRNVLGHGFRERRKPQLSVVVSPTARSYKRFL